MKREGIIKKGDYKFYNKLFKLFKTKYTMATVKRYNSKTYTIYIIFFKKVNPKDWKIYRHQ